MAIASVANNVERHVNPLVEQRRERPAASSPAAKENAASNAAAEDTYTPSDNSAQAAGIFQLNPAALAANTALVQPGPAPDQNATPLPPAPLATTNTAPAQAAAATAGSCRKRRTAGRHHRYGSPGATNHCCDDSQLRGAGPGAILEQCAGRARAQPNGHPADRPDRDAHSKFRPRILHGLGQPVSKGGPAGPASCHSG